MPFFLKILVLLSLYSRGKCPSLSPFLIFVVARGGVTELNQRIGCIAFGILYFLMLYIIHQAKIVLGDATC